MKNSLLFRLLFFLLIYMLLILLGGEIGKNILYPIQLLVTFLHELGHAIAALVSGGKVIEIQIDSNGSGFTKTLGGNRALILIGGYLGSAILGNMIFLVGAKYNKLMRPTIIMLSLAMVFTSIFWFHSLFTTTFLLVFAGVIYFLSKSPYGDELLIFLGMTSVLYIVQDFNVGPSSDLDAYAKEMYFLPAKVWMYIWLSIVLLICYANLKWIFKHRNN